jgi:hypothetical protein
MGKHVRGNATGTGKKDVKFALTGIVRLVALRSRVSGAVTS